MSKLHDTYDKIKLTPENSAWLRDVHSKVNFPVSFTGLVNFILQYHAQETFKRFKGSNISRKGQQ